MIQKRNLLRTCSAGKLSSPASRKTLCFVSVNQADPLVASTSFTLCFVLFCMFLFCFCFVFYVFGLCLYVFGLFWYAFVLCLYFLCVFVFVFLCLYAFFRLYRVIFLTGPPQFQYQKDNLQSANHSCCSSKTC